MERNRIFNDSLNNKVTKSKGIIFNKYILNNTFLI